MENSELYIIKRDGKQVPFNIDKIKNAIRKAFLATGSFASDEIITNVLSRVSIKQGMSVEDIQNQVELSLMVEKYYNVAKSYMLYRQAANPVTVHFHSSASAPISAVSAPDRMAFELHSVSTVMPVVAALESNETTTCPKDAILRAYAHDKLVGEAKAVNGIWFLLVHAADDSELTFTVTDDKGEEQPAANVLHYGAFTPTGTVRNPYLIRFGKSDLEKVIDNGILYIRRNGNIYDAQGALVK